MITSANLYNYSTFGYIIALFSCFLNLSQKKENFRKTITIIIAISFIFQTIGMAFRWFEAGLIEVISYEKAQCTILKGFNWFVVFTQHPPWSNLHEIMLYMSWGLILVFLIVEIKLKIKFLNSIILMLVLTSIGLACLTDETIRPLVPALKSWWLMLHVISASIAYAAGTIGAILSLAYLFKDKEHISISTIASGTMILSAIIGLILGRGYSLLSTASYKVKLLNQNENGIIKVVEHIINNKTYPVFIDSPFVGLVLLLTIITSIIASIFLFNTKKSDDIPNYLTKTLYFIANFSMCSTVIIIIYNNISMKNILLPTGLLIDLTSQGPYKLGFKSNSWDLALFAIILFAQFLVSFSLLKPKIIRNYLPDKNKIDKSAYANIVLAFALVGVVLITGALWAHYAWGRYWGWDPKETGALIIWLIYALYLHSRISKKLSNIHSSIIGIIAFFVVLAGFLGVNLGFFSNGLHSYGNK